MAFRSGPVSGSVVDKFFHPLGNLVLVDPIGDGGTGHSLDRQVTLHVATVFRDLPEFLHMRIEAAGVQLVPQWESAQLSARVTPAMILMRVLLPAPFSPRIA